MDNSSLIARARHLCTEKRVLHTQDSLSESVSDTLCTKNSVYQVCNPRRDRRNRVSPRRRSRWRRRPSRDSRSSPHRLWAWGGMCATSAAPAFESHSRALLRSTDQCSVERDERNNVLSAAVHVTGFWRAGILLDTALAYTVCMLISGICGMQVVAVAGTPGDLRQIALTDDYGSALLVLE